MHRATASLLPPSSLPCFTFAPSTIQYSGQWDGLICMWAFTVQGLGLGACNLVWQVGGVQHLLDEQIHPSAFLLFINISPTHCIYPAEATTLSTYQESSMFCF